MGASSDILVKHTEQGGAKDDKESFVVETRARGGSSASFEADSSQEV